MNKYVNTILFSTFFVVLCTPLTYELFKNSDNIEALNGAFKKEELKILDSTSWFDKTFQLNLEKYIKGNLKIKPESVRFRNQIDYSLYNKYHLADVYFGKEDNMFFKSWFTSRMSDHKFNLDSLNVFMQKLKIVNDYCHHTNKFFKFYIASTKEEIYSEFLPKEIAYANPNNSYQTILNLLEKYKVDYHDFTADFNLIKDTSSFPIYGKTTVHWTVYGAHLAFDQMLEDISKYKNINYPIVDRIELKKFQNLDGDQEQAMNLMWRIDDQLFAYPKYKFDSNMVATPKFLSIVDSYFWALNAEWNMDKIFSKDSKFLFYYKTAYPLSSDKPKKVEEIDLVEEFRTSEIFFLLFANHNMDDFPFGFEQDIDRVLEYIQQDSSFSFPNQINTRKN